MIAPSTMKSSTQRAPKTTRNKAVVLTGPTAVGKTALTESLFSNGFEIINADSVQIYRGLDIGSAKPDRDLQRRIPHHLIDIRDPWEEYSSGDFVKDALSAMEGIWDRGNIPLVTGGTMYYIKHLVYGPPQTPEADMSIRAEVAEECRVKGSEWAYSYLASIDPVSAERINRNDIYRITRAIEVYRASGRPLSSFPLSTSPREDISFALIGLSRDRNILSRRIEQRAAQMFDEGLYDEVRALIDSGADRSWPGMEGIGYREFFDAAEDGESSVHDICDSIIRDSKRYAKRQITFLSSMKEFSIFSPEDEDGVRSFLLDNGIRV